MWFLGAFLLQLLVGVALQVLGYLLMPKSKTSDKTEVDDMENPTAEAGRPIPVPFGEMWIMSPNIIWYGDKATTTREVKS